MCLQALPLTWLLCPGCDKGAFEVVYNPVPTRAVPEQATLDIADRLWSGQRGARILTVGTMKAVKNHRLLLRAFARLDRPDALLMFVGDGTGREALLSLARDLGVADRVIFAGFQPDPTPFYKTADLFVLSSNYEGFGNVIVEALATGTPVVSTDCPSGPAEILENGKWGRLTPVGDADALAEAMRASLKDDHDTAALKRRASRFRPRNCSAQISRTTGLIMPATLYLTRNGLLEPLGQSQVMGYLKGLSQDHQITLITFEKPEDLADTQAMAKANADCKAHGIDWRPKSFRRQPQTPRSSLEHVRNVLVGIQGRKGWRCANDPCTILPASGSSLGRIPPHRHAFHLRYARPLAGGTYY